MAGIQVIIALFVSIITGIAVFQFASSLEKGSRLKTQPVVLATQTIPKGTLIQKEMLKTSEVPIEAIHQLSMGNQDDILGRISKETIEANEQILTSRLSDINQENDNLSYSIEPNYRAVTILVDEEKGVGGYLTKGDRVDLVTVLLTKDGATSQLVVENLEIIKIGPLASGDKGGSYTSVTVSAPAADVTRMNYALAIDPQPRYRLVLRSPVDNDTLGQAPFSP